MSPCENAEWFVDNQPPPLALLQVLLSCVGRAGQVPGGAGNGAPWPGADHVVSPQRGGGLPPCTAGQAEDGGKGRTTAEGYSAVTCMAVCTWPSVSLACQPLPLLLLLLRNHKGRLCNNSNKQVGYGIYVVFECTYIRTYCTSYVLYIFNGIYVNWLLHHYPFP